MMNNLKAPIRIITILILIYSFSAFAQDNQYLRYLLNDQSLTIYTTDGKVTLTAQSDKAIEVYYQYPGIKQLPSWSLTKQVKNNHIKLTEGKYKLTFSIGKLSAQIKKKPFNITFYRNNKLIIKEAQGFYKKENAIGFSFKLTEKEKLMGTGERVVGMNRRGLKLPLYNRAHYGYTTHAPQMNYSIPAVMSSKKYIVLFDNSAKGFVDLAKTEADILKFEAVGGRTSYVIFAADSYPELIEDFVTVTGKQPLPPRWALGNFASRFGYHTQKQTVDTVNKFFSEDIPLDAVVLDLYWFGPEIKGYLGDLEWDKKAFPHPAKMISDFNEQGVKTVMITEPFILSTSSKWQQAVDNDVLAKDENGNPKRFDFYFGNTGLIDVFSENANDWFWQFYQRLMSQGVVGWWGDLGEPEVHPDDTIHVIGRGDELHNVYGHKWSEMIFQRQKKYFPNIRPFLLMRAGFAGSQRFGVFPWTGDVGRAWGGLQAQVELSLQMGLLGLAYTHSDLGGFSNVSKFDTELYTRWLEYGVFQPIYRPHADEVFPSEPVFQDKKTKDIIRKFIKLRYALLPYNYTLAYLNSTTGMPLMRPLFFEDEADDSLIENKNSYLWGKAFLVTPVVKPQLKEVAVDVPKGIWFDFWHDKKIEGGQSIKLPVTLDTIPVLVRAGSFVPMIKPISTTKYYSSKNLKLHYYADDSITNASGMMYEDDGLTNLSIAKKRYEILKFSMHHLAQSSEFIFSKQFYEYKDRPKIREIELILHHWTKHPGEIYLGEKKLNLIKSKKAYGLAQTVAFYDDTKKQLLIKFIWQEANLRLSINKQN